MKKILAGVVVLFLLSGAAVFAYDSDESGGTEVYFGFQFNIDLQDGNTTQIPSFNLGARGYFADVGPGMQLGYSVFANLGFISEMDFGGLKITSDMVNNLTNVGVLLAVSLRGDIANGLGFVADFGFAGNADIGSWDVIQTWFPDSTIAGITVPGTPQLIYNYQIMDFYFGLGLNAALQYRLPVGGGTSALVFEAGANFAFCFFNEISLTGTERELNISGEEIRTASITLTAPTRDAARMRIGPYILIGWRF